MTKFADGLPEMCFVPHPYEPKTFICLTRGQAGYSATTVYTQDHADALNRKLGGVSKAQIAAMEAGSMFGWHVPAADPKRYDANGRFA
jgi:hypothetical protein